MSYYIGHFLSIVWLGFEIIMEDIMKKVEVRTLLGMDFFDILVLLLEIS